MSSSSSDAAGPAQPPRLLDLVRQVARWRFGQDGPAERCAHWTLQFVLFHGKRHPRELTPGDVGRFLEHVSQTAKDPLNTLEQAHTALTFLYHDVLGLPVGELPCQTRRASEEWVGSLAGASGSCAGPRENFLPGESFH